MCVNAKGSIEYGLLEPFTNEKGKLCTTLLQSYGLRLPMDAYDGKEICG